MNVLIASDILGIKVPITKYGLKSAFRKLCLFCHPDTGGSNEKFLEVSEAYNTILADPSSIMDSVDDKNKATRTISGELLSDLGKGYPLNVSAKPCESCEGKGYRILHETKHGECISCGGTGLLRLKCDRCNGSGRYKINGVDRGECFGCKGTGWFVPYHHRKNRQNDLFSSIFGARFRDPKYNCRSCRGIGISNKNTEETYCVICDECKGIGEIKLFNPVLPRGLLTTGVRK